MKGALTFKPLFLVHLLVLVYHVHTLVCFLSVVRRSLHEAARIEAGVWMAVYVPFYDDCTGMKMEVASRSHLYKMA